MSCTKELKILFSGLSDAGKTSIMKVLDNDVESIPSLMPTHGAKITTYKPMGITAHVWDMGGQSRYRQKYLAEFETYFGDTHVLFYVIDVQAPQTFKESLIYLKNVVEILTKLQLRRVFIAILFHKYDPEMQTKKLDKTLKGLWRKIRRIANKFVFSVYRTSIAVPHTILQAFSEGILHPFTEAQVFAQKIQVLAAELNSPAATMQAEGGFTYASWHSQDIDIGDLYKFNLKVHELARFLSDYRDSEFKMNAITDQWNLAAAFFPHQDDYILCALIVANTLAVEMLQEVLGKKRKEFQRVLEVFDDMKF